LGLNRPPAFISWPYLGPLGKNERPARSLGRLAYSSIRLLMK
jgi:hypothetical protein